MKLIRKLIALTVIIAILATSFCCFEFAIAAADGVDELMSDKMVLYPGTIDDLSTENYAYKTIRSGTVPSTLKNMSQCFLIYDAPGYNPTATDTLAKMTQPLGQLMGIRNEKVIFPYGSSYAWAGQTLVYKVVGGTYIATSLVYPSIASGKTYEDLWQLYSFEYSENGDVWTAYTYEEIFFEQENDWTQNKHQLRAGRAVVKLPENAKYYRISCAGFNKEAAGNSFRANGTIWSSEYSNILPKYVNKDNTVNVQMAGIGASIASYGNLAQMETFTPDVRDKASDLQREMTQKMTLSAGTIDNFYTDLYSYRQIRSGELPYDAESSNSCFTKYTLPSYNAGSSNALAKKSEPFGNTMGIKNTIGYFSSSADNAWAGQSVVYKVEANTYVATSLLYPKLSGEKTSEELFELYGFEYSENGDVWTAFTEDEISFTENPFNSSANQLYFAKAVVRIPNNASFYRITFAGYDKEKAGNSLKATVSIKSEYSSELIKDYVTKDSLTAIETAGIGGSFASQFNLNDYDLWNDLPGESEEAQSFVSEMQGKKVLSAGKIDDFTTEYYSLKMVRSRTLPSGVKSDEECFTILRAPTYNPSSTDTLEAMTQPFGNLMGIKNEVVYTPTVQNGWAGQSIVYNVQGGSYIATSLVYSSAISDSQLEALYKLYGFEYSIGGDRWISISHSDIFFEKENGYEAGKHQLASSRAVIKLPEKAKYYRVTCPGYYKNSASTYLRVTNLNIAAAKNILDGFTPACSVTGIASPGISTTICSDSDLSLYQNYSDVPSDNVDKSGLEDILHRVSIVNDYDIVDGATKTEYLSALNNAKQVLSDNTALQNKIDITTLTLENAFGALNFNNFYEASEELSGVENQYSERNFLKPGIFDELRGTPFTTNGTDTVLSHNMVTYCSDYSRQGIISHSNGVNAKNYYYMPLVRDNKSYSAVSFMGKPVIAAYWPLASWSGCYVQYRVYSESYVATALLVNQNPTDPDLFSNLQEDFVFLASKDGENYIELKPESVTLVDSCQIDDITPYAWNLFKAVVKIPSGYTYYRIVAPGAKELSKDTAWYTPNPSASDMRIGPSMASKFDLQLYNNYLDVPDYTPEYTVPVITDADNKKVVITDETLGVLKSGMRLSDVRQAIKVKDGKLVFKYANGKSAPDSAKVKSGMTVTLYDDSGNDYYSNIGKDELVLVMYNDLYKIDTLDTIYNTNGAEKTASGLNLPETIAIYTGAGKETANVKWSVSSCDYDPLISQSQTFKVKGKVKLPSGVKNTLRVSTDITVTVIVNEPYSPSVKTKSGVDNVLVDREALIIYYTKGMTAENLLNAIEPYGDTAYFITQYNSNTDKILNIKNSQRLNVYMGLDVFDKETSTPITYFTFELLDGSISDTSPDTSDDNPYGAYLAVLATVALVVLIKGKMFLSK